MHPAKHYGLILWGHGFGILDPSFRPESQDPSSAWDIELDEPWHGCIGGVKSYMTNAQMIMALKTINQDVLKGEKLDILGTDCCRMAMLEIGYQIKEYAHFLVGSQNVELYAQINQLDKVMCFY